MLPEPLRATLESIVYAFGLRSVGSLEMMWSNGVCWIMIQMNDGLYGEIPYPMNQSWSRWIHGRYGWMDQGEITYKTTFSNFFREV